MSTRSEEVAAPGDRTVVAVYRRTIRASLDRVWENVLDWEHLPWLHGSSFGDILLDDAGAWGWRARVVPSAPAGDGREPDGFRIELLVDREASRYVTRTLEGRGVGTEIWTRLERRADRETDIEVEFQVPGVSAEQVAVVGNGYTRLYARLWDEDEEMMRERETRLVRRRARLGSEGRESVALGTLEALRSKLPFRVEFGGEPVWVIEREGELLAHSAVCPHMLGPLGAAATEGEPIASCPWHGYRFDVRTGRGCGGREYRLRASPSIRVDGEQVTLVAASS